MDCHVLISCYYDMRNRLPEAFDVGLGQTANIFLFHWGWAAVIPGRDAPQDQGHHVLRGIGMLQSPVDGVGEADHLAVGGVGLLPGSIVLRHLAEDLGQQVLI